MNKSLALCGFVAAGLVFARASPASATILGHHAFTWWDDPALGVTVTPLGAAPPAPGSVALLDLEEWHLDQAQTTAWYAGALPPPTMPPNPFNPANGAAIIGAIPPVAGAEAFIYKITNTGFIHGNGFTFSNPPPGPPGPGSNYISGINIIDTHGALAVAAPFAGSQFMSTAGALGLVLDLTPGHVPGTLQDWDFNAFAVGASFEWDIPNEPGPIHPGAGALLRPGVIAGTSAVFGFAMPGNWLDAVNDGWVHSWDGPFVPPGPPSNQVNLTPAVVGFSGPMVPEPGTMTLVLAGVYLLGKRHRTRRAR